MTESIHYQTGTDEPNPPPWPADTVTIVREQDVAKDADDKIRETILNMAQDAWDEEHQTFTCDQHFSSRRHVVMFAPGTYDIRFQVGYYVQVLGMGRSPDEVKFIHNGGPYVPALNRHLHHHHSERTGTCLDTFWRSAENFSMVDLDMVWAVSQASPLRRVHVGGDLYLHDNAAYASGGHLANATIDGTLRAGGQQQFLIRNVKLKNGAEGGAWSMVYVGCTGNVPDATPGDRSSASVTVVEAPKVRMEKPYVALREDRHTFELRVPKPLFGPESVLKGPLLDGSNERVINFNKVKMAVPDFPDEIQKALNAGKDIVLTPGVYHLATTIIMRRSNQVLLGLGLATLVSPRDGSPCITVVPKATGVVIAGVMLEASEAAELDGSYKKVSSLLEWGSKGEEDPGDKQNPGALFDIFCRVGGATTAVRDTISVDTMVRIHSGNVIGDNLWLWRADHALLGDDEANYPHISPIFWQTESHEYKVDTGIEVRGDDVTIYGLAVEHANGHQTIWSGGKC